MDIISGDTLKMKKPHPCGSYDWEVIRTGADIGIKCLSCGRIVFIPRSDIASKVKEVVRK